MRWLREKRGSNGVVWQFRLLCCYQAFHRILAPFAKWCLAPPAIKNTQKSHFKPCATQWDEMFSLKGIFLSVLEKRKRERHWYGICREQPVDLKVCGSLPWIPSVRLSMIDFSTQTSHSSWPSKSPQLWHKTSISSPVSYSSVYNDYSLVITVLCFCDATWCLVELIDRDF